MSTLIAKTMILSRSQQYRVRCPTGEDYRSATAVGLPSAFLSLSRLIHFSRRSTYGDAGRGQEVGWREILSFRRSIAFQIAQGSNSTWDWMGSHSLYGRIESGRCAGWGGRGYIFRLFRWWLIRLRGKISIRRARFEHIYLHTWNRVRACMRASV